MRIAATGRTEPLVRLDDRAAQDVGAAPLPATTKEATPDREHVVA
jgi:hypothetical protein